MAKEFGVTQHGWTIKDTKTGEKKTYRDHGVWLGDAMRAILESWCDVERGVIRLSTPRTPETLETT